MTWDKLKDIITIALIPVLGWVMITMRDIGTLQTKCEQQAAQIMALQAEQKSLNKRTQAIEVQSARIEVQLNALGQQLTRIERMLSVYEEAR